MEGSSRCQINLISRVSSLPSCFHSRIRRTNLFFAHSQMNGSLHCVFRCPLQLSQLYTLCHTYTTSTPPTTALHHASLTPFSTPIKTTLHFSYLYIVTSASPLFFFLHHLYLPPPNSLPNASLSRYSCRSLHLYSFPFLCLYHEGCLCTLSYSSSSVETWGRGIGGLLDGLVCFLEKNTLH